MRLDLDAFRLLPATHIVSLGPRCATTHALRRHFNFNMAFPFDWWITTAAAVATLIRTGDVDDLYDPAKLERTWRNFSVRHKDLGLGLHHEFPRDWQAEGHPIVDDFADHAEKPKQRTRALFERFFALNEAGARLLFVTESADDGALESAVAGAFPLADWHLAVIEGPAEEAVFGWKCDPALWDQRLASLRVELDRSRHEDFVDRI